MITGMTLCTARQVSNCQIYAVMSSSAALLLPWHDRCMPKAAALGLSFRVPEPASQHRMWLLPLSRGQLMPASSYASAPRTISLAARQPCLLTQADSSLFARSALPGRGTPPQAARPTQLEAQPQVLPKGGSGVQAGEEDAGAADSAGFILARPSVLVANKRHCGCHHGRQSCCAAGALLGALQAVSWVLS